MNKKMQAHPVASWAIAHDTIYNPPEEKDGFSYVVAGFTIGAVFWLCYHLSCSNFGSY